MNTMPGPVRTAVTALSPCNFEIVITYTTFQRKLWVLEDACQEKAMHEDQGLHGGPHMENASTVYDKRGLQPVSSLLLQHIICQLPRIQLIHVDQNFYRRVGFIVWPRKGRKKGSIVLESSQNARGPRNGWTHCVSYIDNKLWL